MHPRTRATAVGLVLTAVALLGIACTTTSSPPAEPPPPAAEVSDTPAEDPAAEQRRAGREIGGIALGDLNKPPSPEQVGSPIDPCALSWTDFPAPVRPTDGKPHKPTPQPPGRDDPWEIYCRYENSGALVLENGKTTSSSGRFIVSVMWGRKLSADPGRHAGAEQTTFAGKKGLLDRQPDGKAGGCVGYVDLATGAAATSVTNGTFPKVDPCDVVTAVMTAVATKAR